MSINNIQIAQKIRSLLGNVLEEVDYLNSQPMKSIEIRDKILQSSVLLELLASESQPYSREIGDGLSLLKLCLADIHLSANKMQTRVNNEKHEKASEVPEPPKIDPAVLKIETIDNIKFTNIVGCEKAKQALRENIIYHLTLPDEVLTATFTGIRSGAGNVLLHGPPGTGKTLLAQAAAAEAVIIRPFLLFAPPTS